MSELTPEQAANRARAAEIGFDSEAAILLAERLVDALDVDGLQAIAALRIAESIVRLSADVDADTYAKLVAELDKWDRQVAAAACAEKN